MQQGAELKPSAQQPNKNHEETDQKAPKGCVVCACVVLWEFVEREEIKVEAARPIIRNQGY